MFTQACFIKNYKRDLISKIENIGYRNCYKSSETIQYKEAHKATVEELIKHFTV